MPRVFPIHISAEFQVVSMSEQNKNYSDGTADAIATVAIIAIIVTAAVYWLSHMQ